ncbi:MAG: MBOAT family protein [Myxococcales bacterium]|nr:MBOAT family protein [Myxococcales bacterium]
MIFTSAQFVLFFIAFFTVYPALKGQNRKHFLLLSSWVFYGCFSLPFLLLLIATTVLDYQIAGWISRSDDARRRRLLITGSVVANLGVLAFFKYCNFFVDSAVRLSETLGLSFAAPALHIVLPVGISFYTFQSMSYTIDVYRRRMSKARTFEDFALYVAFFPQLVAGPIERGHQLVAQVQRVGTSDEPAPDFTGFLLIAMGVFKKVVIADHMAVLVDATYAHPENTPGPALWLGTYAFAMQIYFDFSGYSDIAMGLGRLLGFDLMQNFRAPYSAESPSDFWRRWHISLSTWLRDYLYIPLGGNRGTGLFTSRNLFLTMLLGGLWHGAAWNYVLWGAFHGTLLLVWRFLPNGGEARPRPGALGLFLTGLRRVLFFHLICLGWALFRASSLSDCGSIFSGLFGLRDWDLAAWLKVVKASGEGPYLAFMAASMVALVLVQQVFREGTVELANRAMKAPLAVRVFGVCIVLYVSMLLASEKPPPFIYFQF